MKLLTASAISALACLSPVFATPLDECQNSPVVVNDFSQLTPSADLDWTPCFDEFTCSLLTVPLDYEDEAAGTTNIAFIKWTTNATSTNSSNPPQDVLINPGGPGDSGIKFLMGFLPYLKLALGTQYNYVGFDPRGVNNSGPDLSYFPGQQNTRSLYDKEFSIGTYSTDSNALAETWARAGAFGEWCSNVHSSPNSTSKPKYANTVATATDMLQYIKLLAKSRREEPDDSQLWYYGVSYCTTLGSTFASLFPDRVGWLMLDGVVDSQDYYSCRWETNLFDADAVVEFFFTSCFEAGAANCTFWAESPEAIEQRFLAVIDSIRERPLTVTNPNYVQFPDIIRFKDLQTALLAALYAPTASFPLLAQGLVALEAGNADLLARTVGAGQREGSTNSLLPLPADFEPLPFIACIDAMGRYNLTDYDAWVDQVNTLVGESHYVGDAWAALVSVNCRSLNIRAPPSQVFTGTPCAANTSNPILFISNTIDPVTPLRSAVKMQGQFGGAGLLVQDAVGHSSTVAFSRCTAGYVRKYLQDGSLPPEGTVCEVEELPFQSSAVEAGAVATISKLRRSL